MYFAGLEIFKLIHKESCRSVKHKSTLTGCWKGKIVAFMVQDFVITTAITKKIKKNSEKNIEFSSILRRLWSKEISRESVKAIKKGEKATIRRMTDEKTTFSELTRDSTKVVSKCTL